MLLAELWCSQIGRHWTDWDDMNTLDAVDFATEVCRPIDLVFKQYASHFIVNEICRLHGIIGLHQEVILESTFLDGEAKVAGCFKAVIASDTAPHLQGIGREAVFTGTFLIFAIGAIEQSFSLFVCQYHTIISSLQFTHPAVSSIPVE